MEERREVLINVVDVSKRFGVIQALNNVSFTLHKGEIKGLAGHNGAGKSVLIKIMGGFLKPDKGKIYFEGREVKFSSPKDAQEMGYYVVPQELNIAAQLSIADNIFIGKKDFVNKYGIIKEKYIYEESKKILKELFNIDVDPYLPAGELDTVTQRLIQVVRCINVGAKVIVFDETTAGLTHNERDKLFQHMRLLTQKGIGIIFVSHIISEMLEICDNITVLREGNLISTEKVENLTTEKLIELIAGKELEHVKHEKLVPSEKVLFSVQNLSTKNGKLSDINFQVRKGEILGIYGLRDQGQTLLLDSIFGAYRLKSGYIEIEGKAVEIKSPVDGIKNGIVYLPERGKKTNFLYKSILENLIIQLSNYLDKSFFIKKKSEEKIADQIVKKFNVRGYSSFDQKLSSLSGGNIQKVLIGRVMLVNPKLLIFKEPTQGIDIGAKEEIKQLISKMSEEGKGIIIVSSEIDEIIELCHRVVIIREGKCQAVMEAKQQNRNLIIATSIG